MSYKLFLKLFKYKNELNKFLTFIIFIFIVYLISPFVFILIENKFGEHVDTIYNLLFVIHFIMSTYVIYKKVCISLEHEMVFLKMLSLDNIKIFQVLFIRQISTYYILCMSYILLIKADDFYSIFKGIFIYSFIYVFTYMLSNILLAYTKCFYYMQKLFMFFLFIACSMFCFYGAIYLNKYGFDKNTLLEKLQSFFLNNRTHQIMEKIYLEPTFTLVILNLIAYIIIKKVINFKYISYQTKVKKVRNLTFLDKFYSKNHNIVLFHIKREYAMFLRNRSMTFFKLLFLVLYAAIAILSKDFKAVAVCAGFFIIILMTAQQFIYKAEVCNRQLYKQLPYTYDRFLINKILCGWLYMSDGILIILLCRLLITCEGLYYGVGILLFSIILSIYVNIIFSSYYTKMKAEEDLKEKIFMLIIGFITFIPGVALIVGVVSYKIGKREWKKNFEGLDENVSSR